MKYILQGDGEVLLNEQNFVAQGGEGKIYAEGAWIYKVYTNPRQMISPSKIQELAVLDHTWIIRPRQLLLDTQGTPIGFSMARVEQATALPRLFTNDFRNQQRIQQSTILRLLENIRQTIDFIHTKGCLMVDGNEMNYLVAEQDFAIPFFIDVDSYQTPSFPATAIMPTIRDYHSAVFSPLTDWFAFAVIACQVLIGIHPYKGKHPQFKKGDVAARMQANASIFNPQVSLPAAVRDFNLIPADIYDWFIRLFEKGERLPPPAFTAAAPALPITAAKAIPAAARLSIHLQQTFSSEIHRFYAYQGKIAVFTADALFLEQKTYPLPPENTQIIYAPKTLSPLLASIHQQFLQVIDVENNQALAVHLKAEHLLTLNNQLYAVYQDNLTRLNLSEYGGKKLISPGTNWKIMPKAHQVLEGMIYQNVLGKPYLVIPYRQACMIREIPELAGYRILNGKHDSGVAMMIAYKNGQYDRFCLRFDENYTHYTTQLTENIDQLDINVVVLDNGVVAHLPHDGELEIFTRSGDAVKIVQDTALRSDMRLTKDGVKVLFYSANKLYRLQLN